MNYQFSQKQSGVTLFVALIMLLVLTIIGLTASQRSGLQEKMAGNMHTGNMTFSASESAIGAFMNEANIGNKLLPGHVLYELRMNDNIDNKEYDMNGVRVAAAYLDSNNGNNLKAIIQPKIYKDCVKTCPGFSFDGAIGCRYYELDGVGQLNNNGEVLKETVTTMWAKEMTVCK